jgi:hypothetical protein
VVGAGASTRRPSGCGRLLPSPQGDVPSWRSLPAVSARRVSPAADARRQGIFPAKENPAHGRIKSGGNIPKRGTIRASRKSMADRRPSLDLPPSRNSARVRSSPVYAVGALAAERGRWIGRSLDAGNPSLNGRERLGSRCTGPFHRGSVMEAPQTNLLKITIL